MLCILWEKGLLKPLSTNCDNGLLNVFLSDPQTQLLENIVALALMKRYGNEVYGGTIDIVPVWK